jgi:hypothetical protein
VSEPDEAPRLQTVPDIQAAVGRAKTPTDRRRIYERAAHLGLLSKLPKQWTADGTVEESR